MNTFHKNFIRYLLKILSFYDPLFSNADFNIVTKHMEIYYGAANSRDLNVD